LCTFQGIAANGYVTLHQKNFLKVTKTRNWYFRLVKRPTQLFFYKNEKTKRPKGKVLLKDKNGGFLDLTMDEKIVSQFEMP